MKGQSKPILRILGIPSLALFISSSTALAANVAQTQSFTYEGQLLNEAGTEPLTQAVTMTLGIYDKDVRCLLYEESQNVDLSETGGLFSVRVGSGPIPAADAVKRTANDPQKSMAQIFSNSRGEIVPNNPLCVGGYTPQEGHARKLKVQITTQAGTVTLSPELVITAAPLATIAESAESIQGLIPADLIQVNGTVSQASLETLTAGASTDASALHSHDSLYAKSAGGLLSLPAASPSTAGWNATQSGRTWFESGEIKYWDGSAVKTLGTGSATGVTSFNTRTGAVTLLLADLTAALGFTPEPALPSNGTSAKYLRGDKTWQTLDTDAVPEGTKKYYSDAQAKAALTADAPITYNVVTGHIGLDATTGIWTASGSDVYRSAGKVGIGTTTPATRLDVSGTLKVGNGAEACNASLGGAIRYLSPNIEFCNGVAWTAASASGSYLSSTGGTLSGALTISSATLDVQGGTAADDVAGSNISLTAQNGGAGNAAGGNIILTAGTPTGSANPGIINVKSRAVIAHSASITSPWTSIQHSSGPTYSGALNVLQASDDYRGAIHAGTYGGGAHQYAIIGMRQNSSIWNGVGGAVTIGDTLPGIGFAGQSLTGDFSKMVIGAAVQGVVDYPVSSLVLPTGIKFSTTTTDSSGLTERMRITSSGRVGIRKTNPSAELDVNGVVQASAFLTSGGMLIGENYGINFGESTNQDVIYGSNASHYLVFRTNGTDRIRVDSAGNVGIGTSAPGYTLDVSGDLRIIGTPYRSSGDIAWQVPSDARLKTVQGSYHRGLEALLGFDVIRYRYKEGNEVGADATREFIGVLAQDVQKVIPEAVSTDKKGYLSLNTSPIFWTIVNSVKDLYQKITAQDRNLASLKAELEATKEAAHRADERASGAEQKAEQAQKENAQLRAYLCTKDPQAPFCR